MRHSPARTVYEAAVHDRPLPPEVRIAKRIADDTWEELARAAKAEGLSAPGDDRAEEVVTAMFSYLVEAVGLDLRMLADVIEKTDVKPSPPTFVSASSEAAREMSCFSTGNAD